MRIVTSIVSISAVAILAQSALSQSAFAQSPTPAPPTAAASACAQALSAGPADPTAGEICAGEEAARVANGAPKDSRERTRQLEVAVDHYRKAITLSNKVPITLLVLGMLEQAYDAQHLNQPKPMEQALRDIVRLTPDDLAPVKRLARLLEDQNFIDAAEDTLQAARRQQPEAVEPNRMLAQFYARRVTALHKDEVQKEPAPSAPGERDENGVYRVGGSVAVPSRLDVAKYPPEAAAAGITGMVVAEVVIDTAGNVTDAKVINSIPLLDESALRAVRNWHFAPTMVNGQPVPVKMNLNVNFTLPPSSPTPAPAPQQRK